MSNFFRTINRLWRRLIARSYYRLVLGHIGKGSLLDPPLLIVNPGCIFIGERTLVRRGARLEVVRTEFVDQPSLTIGNDCFIEQNVQIISKGSVTIGNDVSIAGHCAIVDVTHPYWLIDAAPNIGSRILDKDQPVRIDRGCFIGFGSVVLPGVHLADGCVVGANSVVTRSFGPRSVIAGAPAKLVKNY